MIHASSHSSSPDAKPTIDAIVHDTFTLHNRTNSPLCSLSRAITPKVPTFVTRGQRPRPHVTICYFQSLDAAVGVSPGNEASLLLSHRLRTSHDAVLTDQLISVTSLPGMDGNGDRSPIMPTVVLLDEHLHTTDQSNQNLNGVWIVVRGDLAGSRAAEILSTAGARLLFTSPFTAVEILEQLYNIGLRKVVIEGIAGAKFLAQGLFDKLIVGTVPVFAAGQLLPPAPRPRLTNVHYEVLGTDIVMTAEPELESTPEPSI